MRPARALIDRAAWRHNLQRVRAYAPNSRVMAVIKANAYGHGAADAALALSDADAFAVASCTEALELRAAGVAQPIVLLEGPFKLDEVAIAAEQGFECIIHNDEQLPWLAGESGPRFWLKLDTGMHRLGFSASRAGELQQVVAQPAGDRFCGWLMHFACADEPDHSLNRTQLERFETAIRDHHGARSLANSAAIVDRPVSHADWVRPGIMLYGASPMLNGQGTDLDLLPVMTLQSALIAVKAVSAGETVGYGSTWQAQQNTRIGIVAIGYGDGYPRHAPSGTPVLVNGVEVKLVGRVSMDMIAVDLDEMPAAVGDPVILWGQGLPAERVARAADTIAYELFCNVAPRVPRECIN